MFTISRLFLCLVMGSVLHADEKPEPVKHRITGLFSPDRVADLREVMAEFPDIELVNVDFERAEATFRYDPSTAFPNTKPEQIVERFDARLRQATRSTFGVKPLCTIPADKLQRIEIPAAGLDCKACCLAAYESIFRIDGVETATASFREGLITAQIDPTRTDQATLEAALRKRGVDVTAEPSPQP